MADWTTTFSGGWSSAQATNIRYLTQVLNMTRERTAKLQVVLDGEASDAPSTVVITYQVDQTGPWFKYTDPGQVFVGTKVQVDVAITDIVTGTLCNVYTRVMVPSEGEVEVKWLTDDANTVSLSTDDLVYDLIGD